MRNLQLLRMEYSYGDCWDSAGNNKSGYWRFKYSDSKCFSSVTQMEDPNGNVGVAQFRDLMAVVGDALKTNIMTLGSFVLHISEQLLFFANLTRKTVLKMKLKLKPYIPEFELAFEHFCILAGGRWCSMNWRRAFSCWSVNWSSQGWLCTGLETSF